MANEYTTGGAVEGTNLPSYVGQSDFYKQIRDWLWNRINGGMPGQGVLDRVRNLEPTPFLDRLPWSGGQIADYAGNLMSGKRASQIATDWGNRAMDELKKTAYQGYKSMSGQSAATGGRGSSAEAALKAKGLQAFGSAKTDVLNTQQNLEETMRNSDFTKGMGVLGAYQSAANQDWTNALNNANLALNSLSPELAWNQAMNSTASGLMSGESTEQNSQNTFNTMLYQLLKQNGGGGGFMNLLGQLINGGATYAAAVA